ncbi:hypothetical protein BHM03_00033849 [Ensete ventricosum]|nr:hypothetical protein BHM03_00033849 [Ensete ventricosum]
MSSSVLRISIGGVDNCEYNVQSNRHDLRPGMFVLWGCLGGCSRGSWANTSRLIGRDGVVVHIHGPRVTEMIVHVDFGLL